MLHFRRKFSSSVTTLSFYILFLIPSFLIHPHKLFSMQLGPCTTSLACARLIVPFAPFTVWFKSSNQGLCLPKKRKQLLGVAKSNPAHSPIYEWGFAFFFSIFISYWFWLDFCPCSSRVAFSWLSVSEKTPKRSWNFSLCQPMGPSIHRIYCYCP